MSWETGWIVLLVIGAIMELVAIFNDRKGDTLSEQVWKWLRIDKGESNWHIGRILLVLGLVWLLLHFGWRIV